MRWNPGLVLSLAAVAAAPSLAAQESAASLIEVGDPAPDFTLDTVAGAEHTLSEAATDGPVVLVLYRGVW